MSDLDTTVLLFFSPSPSLLSTQRAVASQRKYIRKDKNIQRSTRQHGVVVEIS